MSEKTEAEVNKDLIKSWIFREYFRIKKRLEKDGKNPEEAELSLAITRILTSDKVYRFKFYRKPLFNATLKLLVEDEELGKDIKDRFKELNES